RLKQLDIGTFVFTADHGFLIQDTTTADPQRYGATRREPKPRWVLSPHAEQPTGCVRVPLAALGYDAPERDAHLILRRDTKVFAAGASATSFCHGGNSLQERVVPVLTASYRASSRLRLEHYRIVAAGRAERRAGVYRLALVVRPREEAQSVLDIARDRDLAVALDVVGERDVAPVIYDLEGGTRRHGHWRVPVGEKVVVCFDLRGPRDARVRIRIYHPESDDRVEELRPETFFEVAGIPRRAPEQKPPAEPPEHKKQDEAMPSTPSWADAFDAPTARVFLHLEGHGSITEDELVTLLGGPRPARRFARDFDDHLERVPFAARVEVVGGVKRYVREN
ncbi:MAG: PglZ domain-containing protein, partial [bacterium]|nr:PglZ domain-containing protein [bacterium]